MLVLTYKPHGPKRNYEMQLYKEFKRKSNKVEKEAIRELKKDTATVQGEMQKERAWRKKAASRTTFKVGDKGVRDEV